MSESEKALISAGAVLPGTAAAGEDRDTITARHYAHPGLEGRVVVRLVPAVLGRAEDLTCEYLGFGGPARTAEVGTGRRSALGFPAWALINDPANAHHALNLVKDVERLARTAKSRAGAAKDGFTALGDMLGRSAPHFLPTFYEQAGRIFLQHGNTTYAASMFGKAREAEEVHDLAVDSERTREVFLEFAFAGALTAKALSAHSKGLARKHEPEAAYELFVTLCVERTRGGLPPYTGMPEDLRRLAKAAKRNVKAEDERLLRAVLDSSAISRAGVAFWKSYRDALVALATRDDEVRARLLAFLPASASVLDTWFEILDACGASRALVEPGGAVDAAEWLSSVVSVRSGGWRTVQRSRALLELAEAMAPRLAADAVPVRALIGWRQGELDLLDVLVSHGVPLVPHYRDGFMLNVADWLADEGEGRRDLTALAESELLGRPLAKGLIDYANNLARRRDITVDTLTGFMSVPGLRIALRQWISRRAARDLAGLPELSDQLAALAVVRLPEAFADVPEAAEAIAATDVGAALHATLRAGLLDELGWPALDEAVAELAEGKASDEKVVVCGEGWPALVLRRGETFVVVGPDGVLARHVSRIPMDARGQWGFEPTAWWFDGRLLVRWPGPDHELAYWSDAPDRVFAPQSGIQSYHRRDGVRPSIALTDGARFGGRRAVHPGDTQVPEGHAAFGDGTSLWTSLYLDQGWRWVEVDPATGETGRTSLPRFLEDFAADGAALSLDGSDLRPAVPATAASPFGVADGLHGWRLRREADGSWLGEGVDGRRVRLPRSNRCPVGVLALPGGARLTVSRNSNSVSVLDENGTTLGMVSVGSTHPEHAAGTPLVVPVEWWHVLRPRDEAGSAALRAVTRKSVDAMIAAALAENGEKRSRLKRLSALLRGERDDLAATVAVALPGLTDPALLAGVLAVVRHAAELARHYAGYAEIAAGARKVDKSAFAPAGPVVSEEDVESALGWFRGQSSGRAGAGVRTALPELLSALAETAAQPKPEGRALPESGSSDWFKALPHLGALAYRAASPLVPENGRGTLAVVLRCLGESGLAEGTGHWRVVGFAVPEGDAKPLNRVIPVRDGFIAVFKEQWRHRVTNRYEGVQFTRTPGTFDLPRGWHVEFAQDVRAPFGRDRVDRFLTVLAERGPVPWSAEAVTALSERTGLGTAEAAVLLAGMPGVDRWDANYLSTADRHLLGLSAAGAKAAKQRLRPLDDAFRRRLLAAAVPEDPADLWTTGPDVDAVAAVWVAEQGRRRPVPDEVLVDAAKLLPLSDAGEYVTGVVDPDHTAWLTTDAEMRFDGTSLAVRHPDGFTEPALRAVPQVLRWLAYRLPAGSELRPSLPAALSLARQRVADPGFVLQPSGWLGRDDLRGLLGVDLPAEGAVVDVGTWLHVIGTRADFFRVAVRPGLIGPQDRDLLTALLELTHSWHLQRALDELADEGLTAACAVAATGDPAAYHQVPDQALVAEAAGRLGLDEDAALLYLQLLALPDPTDANVARWTGWKPARLRKARAALAETDLVLTAKRARAGRSLFLPGGWLALASPHLPLESWKAPMFGFTTQPVGVIAPREPVADLFARAWQRVQDGDAPAYEELKTGGRR
ncbi:hypothetical protein FHS29_000191 [Saccharothrix tamanrassetensis]|uniref:DNA-binding protein n=1 Tax=Saccharothrix tamanrassetensis TaxID=1051531 RepID=A0A841C916_9PSEU|nr:hypothetical protein [Saccharothrix tamanrassetensis]MBB5953621.1 hypothetical protein [Saccharothrix tamanrassetensis]